MFRDDPPPPLFVPDLAPPLGARVEHGQVTCVVCGAQVALAQADIVGQGYRCAACSQRADLAALAGAAADPALHLSHGDVVGLTASGRRLTWLGLLLLAIGAAATAYLIDIGARVSPGVGLVVFGGGLTATGLRRCSLARSVNGAAPHAPPTAIARPRGGP